MDFFTTIATTQVANQAIQVARKVGPKVIEHDKDLVFSASENPEEKMINHQETAQANFKRARGLFGQARKRFSESLFVELNKENFAPTLKRFASGIVAGARGLVNLYQASHHTVEVAKRFLYEE